MSDTRPCRIVIVGGGTAGWLAALMLSHRLADAKSPADITVVESSRIPTIGVGEGTTAVFRQVLRILDLDEADFLASTGATIKYGIRHRDWRRLGHVYDGPIDDPHALSRMSDEPLPWLDVAAVAAGESVSQYHLFHWLMRLDKAPVGRHPKHGLIPVGPFDHAFHFDQARVGDWLRTKAVGVNQIDMTVTSVERNDNGDIRTLIGEDGVELSGNFFIDCTGFRRQLVGGELGVSWTSYREALPVNRAMPFWLPHTTDGAVPPYTLAWAQKAGWLWTIPTRERLGCGYVYDDSFCTPEQAQAEIESVLGHAIEPRADLQFDCGRLERSWVGNCVALGLASSFLEPLEATSIHGTVVQLMLLTTRHLDDQGVLRFIDAEGYNRRVARQVDDFRDFINLHYLSERNDSGFWCERVPGCITAENRERVARWRSAMPRRDEFIRLIDALPHVEEQLYYPVLDGLGVLSRETAKSTLAASPTLRSRARKTRDSLEREYRRAAAAALPHGSWLNA